MRLVFISKSFSQTTLLSGLLLLMITFTQAAPGDLDLTFGNGGKVTTNIGSFDYLNAMAIQPDGKIVAVGNSVTIRDTFAVVRYNTIGTLDTSFDGDGIAIIQSLQGIPEAVSIQPDGKIVIAGRLIELPNRGFTVARLNTNGSLDTSFDGDGIVQTQIGAGPAYAFAVAIQSDGKIVVGGFSFIGNDSDFAVIRYNRDGALDTSFDGDGIVTTPIGNGSNQARELGIAPDGKIVLAGQIYSSNGSDYGIVRYKPDGSLDASFDGDGIVVTSIGTIGFDYLNALGIQPDGKIVAAGSYFNGTTYELTVVRYTLNGALDSSFDTDGIVFTPVGSTFTTSQALSIQVNGKIVIAGWHVQGNDDFIVVRYNIDGSPDTSFGDDGIVLTPIGNGHDDAYALGIQPDGKIVAAGWTHNGTNYDYGLIRYEGDTITPRRAPFDFDGDSKTDISIFRSSVGEWWYLKSSDGGNSALQFGSASDKLTPGDFTGDGKTDIAFFRPSTGEWFVLRSEDFSFFSFPFGISGDIPVPADYDGDERTDAAVFRPSTLTWFINKSSGGTTITTFGANGDVPVVADYDGDGRSDVAIFRASLGQWWIERSSNGQVFVVQFGNSTDKPVQGDYTGDGKADAAIWRSSSGEWFVLRSEDSSFYSIPFGTNGDFPAPGDYDGDSKYDAAVFRPSSSTWYVNRSMAGILIQGFGLIGDVPVPSAFIP